MFYIENIQDNKIIGGITESKKMAELMGWTQTLPEIEKGYDGFYYAKGFAPERPEPTYTEKRQREYPPISEQLDMIYWDKVNGTNLWQEKITEIKTKYPKE